MPSPAVDIQAVSRFWQLPIATLLEHLNSSPEGLSNAEASVRLAHFGPNLIHGERKQVLLLQFLAKFLNPLVIILLIASALSAFTGDATSFFIISVIVIISVTPVTQCRLLPDENRRCCGFQRRQFSRLSPLQFHIGNGVLAATATCRPEVKHPDILKGIQPFTAK